MSFLTEIWEKADNQKHQNKFQELFKIKGLLYISTPRLGLKRGGGVAFVADPIRFILSLTHIIMKCPGDFGKLKLSLDP